MKSITIEGQVRNESGKRQSATMKREGNVPCVVYGGKENINFYAPADAFRSLVYTPVFQTIKLKIGDQEKEAVIKDLQFDPVTDRLLHIDFLELVADKKITVEVPLQMKGIAKGVREGGKLIQKLRKIKVKCFPKDLKDFIEVSIDHLELGKSVKVSDIKVNNMEILNSPSIPVASVEVPRAMKGKTEEPAAGAKAAPAAKAAAPAAKK